MPGAKHEWKLPNDVMTAVMYDVAGEVPTSKSKLKYDDEMLKFRNVVEAEWTEWRKTHPESILYIPEDLPSEDIPTT